jgi:CheY-like chemotaxis protein
LYEKYYGVLFLCNVLLRRNSKGFGLRFLVVDDNEEITEVITFYCSAKKDIDCHVVNGGPQGLDRIRKENFDLILLDVAILGFSGWDILQSLKIDGLLESKNIVVFTASSDQKLFNDIKNAGVKEVFKKPFIFLFYFHSSLNIAYNPKLRKISK